MNRLDLLLKIYIFLPPQTVLIGGIEAAFIHWLQ